MSPSNPQPRSDLDAEAAKRASIYERLLAFVAQAKREEEIGNRVWRHVVRIVLAILLVAFVLGLLFAFAKQAPTSSPPLETRVATFSPDTDDYFGVRVNAKGNVTFADQNVIVDLNRITFEANPRYGQSRYVDSYVVCLAGLENGRWNKKNCSAPVPVSAIFPLGELVSIPNRSFSIPFSESPMHTDMGLVLELKGQNERGVTYYFTHSQLGLFR